MMKKTTTEIKQIAIYSIIGMSATGIEWILFYLFNQILHMNYIPATVIAMTISNFANWVLGRLLMFKSSGNNVKEIISVYLTCFIGFLLNIAFMWIMIEKFAIWEMAAKMIATCLVFTWNYLIRTRLIYRNKNKLI